MRNTSCLCTAFFNMRQDSRWKEVFDGHGSDMKAVMEQKNQLKLARFIVTALKVRQRRLEAMDREGPQLDTFSSSEEESWG